MRRMEVIKEGGLQVFPFRTTCDSGGRIHILKKVRDYYQLITGRTTDPNLDYVAIELLRYQDREGNISIPPGTDIAKYLDLMYLPGSTPDKRIKELALLVKIHGRILHPPICVNTVSPQGQYAIPLERREWFKNQTGSELYTLDVRVVSIQRAITRKS